MLPPHSAPLARGVQEAEASPGQHVRATGARPLPTDILIP